MKAPIKTTVYEECMLSIEEALYVWQFDHGNSFTMATWDYLANVVLKDNYERLYNE